MSDVDTFIEVLLSRGSEAKSPLKAIQIAEIENKKGFRLPESLMDFYKKTDGLTSGEAVLSLWPIDDLEKVVPGFMRSEDEVVLRSIAFADYLIYSRIFFFDPVNNRIYRIDADGNNKKLISDNFDNFKKLVIEKDKLLDLWEDN